MALLQASTVASIAKLGVMTAILTVSLGATAAEEATPKPTAPQQNGGQARPGSQIKFEGIDGEIAVREGGQNTTTHARRQAAGAQSAPSGSPGSRPTAPKR